LILILRQKRPWIRIQNPVSRSALKDKTLDLDPDPHSGLCGSETLIFGIRIWIQDSQCSRREIKLKFECKKSVDHFAKVLMVLT